MCRDRIRLDAPAEHIEKRLALLGQALLEPLGTVAGAACPGLTPILVSATAAIMGILYPGEIEILLPVRPLFQQRTRAITHFDPAAGLILKQSRVLHVAKVLAFGDRPSPQGASLNRFQ